MKGVKIPLVLCLIALWCFNKTDIMWREYKCLWYCAWLPCDVSIERSLCEGSANASGSVPDCSVTFSSLHLIVIVITTVYPFPWTRCSSLFVTSPSTISANYSDDISHRTILLILLVSSLFPFLISLDNNCGNFVNSFSTFSLEHPVK